jgi:hypothetical protein
VIRYEVEITGHEPPYQWQVYRTINQKRTGLSLSGEAKTQGDAIEAAEEKAREWDWEQRHRATKVAVLLFESDEIVKAA